MRVTRVSILLDASAEHQLRVVVKLKPIQNNGPWEALSAAF